MRNERHPAPVRPNRAEVLDYIERHGDVDALKAAAQLEQALLRNDVSFHEGRLGGAVPTVKP